VAKFDLNLLEVIAAIDETCSVTKAAKKLRLSQPGLSSALTRARQYFDDPLFVRVSGGMKPTPRGHQLADEARSILQMVDERVLEQPRFVPSETQTVFRFAMPDIADVVFLPPLLQAMRVEAPNASLQTASYPPGSLEAAMEEGKVDLALGYLPDLVSTAFQSEVIMKHSFSCLLRRDHPSASNLTAEAFSDLEHVVVDAPIRSQELVEEFLKEQKIERKVRVRSGHYLALPTIVAQTDLIATVPTALANSLSTQAGIVVVTPPFEIPTFHIKHHWHRRYDLDPRIQWLRRLILELFQD